MVNAHSRPGTRGTLNICADLSVVQRLMILEADSFLNLGVVAFMLRKRAVCLGKRMRKLSFIRKHFVGPSSILSG